MTLNKRYIFYWNYPDGFETPKHGLFPIWCEKSIRKWVGKSQKHIHNSATSSEHDSAFASSTPHFLTFTPIFQLAPQSWVKWPNSLSFASPLLHPTINLQSDYRKRRRALKKKEQKNKKKKLVLESSSQNTNLF